MLLAIGAIVVGVGNWYTHAKHLQTKVDAGAFAGGSAWGFPCGADIDADIEAQARLYVGSHTAANLASVSSPHNPQVGGVGGEKIYASSEPGRLVARKLRRLRLLESRRGPFASPRSWT